MRFSFTIALLLFTSVTLAATKQDPICRLMEQVIELEETTSITRKPLTVLDGNKGIWRHMLEDMPYYLVGNSPRDISIGAPPAEKATIPFHLKARGERELVRVRKKLKLPSAEFEMWPSYDDWTSVTWIIARYRESPRHAWKFLDGSFENPKYSEEAGAPTFPIFPEILKPGINKGDEDQIFNHHSDSLYQRPDFAQTLFLSPDMRKAHEAWIRSPKQEERLKAFCKNTDCTAAVIPPPSRLNDTPTTFIVRSDKNGAHYPDNIVWKKENRKRPKAIALPPLIKWAEGAEDKLEMYDKMYSGQIPIYDPATGKKIDFTKQGSGQPDNELIATANHLSTVGEGLGFKPLQSKGLTYKPKEMAKEEDRFTSRIDKFNWEGIPQAQYIATIKGKHSGPSRRIFVNSAHPDKAIAEDVYDKTGKRLTNPGADDNASGVAALLVTMEALRERYKDESPEHDIEFVFDTGEEYPAGTVGARKYVTDQLVHKEWDVVNINYDMIGYRAKGDRIFQINPGNSPGSWELAELILGTAMGLNKTIKNPKSRWIPNVLYPWSLKRQFDQTSGGSWDWAGYPNVTGNEHLNLKWRQNPDYHQDADRKIKKKYAFFQTRVFAEGLVRGAEGLWVPTVKRNE